MDRKYWIWFSKIKKLTCVQKEKLLNKYGTIENIWNLDVKKLKNETMLSDEEINAIVDKTAREKLEQYEYYMEKNNIKMINIMDDEYPEKLKNIYDKPIVLFTKGNTELLKNISVAMVGCRDCTNYGKKIAQKLAYDLAKENICIVSGLAKGIDKFSHIGALEAKGKTIAVIGNGLDYVYPFENKDLYERIIKNNGLIVTEYIIGTKPEKLNFPARNRIISALSNAVVVVEAKVKSGSLITAEFGLEYGKEILAVPGNIDNLNSQGTNLLIKDGACVVTNYKDVLNCVK